MQKIKSPALKGIQIHHQREKESRTNPDIQEERSHENYDLVHSEDIAFHQRVKEIIESQKIGTRKTRKDAVLVNELLITSDEHFFKQLSVSERERFFEESYRIFSERYGTQNVAYARVHLDEKTPHMHLGIVPIREGRLQSKNIFNRQELQWIQDSFPKTMQALGFDLERGEKGSDREHIEMARFKKMAVENETKSLAAEIENRKNELSALNRKIPDDVEVKAKRQSKMVEVPIGERHFWGQEKTKKEKQYTGNVIVLEKDYQKLIDAAKGNKRLKTSIENYLKTDLVQVNRNFDQENKSLQKENETLKTDLKLAKATNETLERKNRRLEETVNELKTEIKLLYQNIKDLLIPLKNDPKVLLRSFTDKLIGKHPKSEFARIHEANEQKQKGNFSLEGLKELDQQVKKEQRKQKNKSYDMER